MSNIFQHVPKYLKSQATLWSPTTLKSTASRLNTIANLQLQAPYAVYNKLNELQYNPYTIKTMFGIIAKYIDWCVENKYVQENRFSKWIKENSQVFRNVYQDKYTTMTYTGFVEEFNNCSLDMRLPLALLGFAGCRISELHTYDGKTVLGKGGKRRLVFLPTNLIIPKRIALPIHIIRRRLKYCPHEYRKLAADTWFKNKIDLKTVQTLLGHVSINTTQRYLRPMQNKEIQGTLNNLWSSL